MHNYRLSEISKIIKGKIIQLADDIAIEYLLTDNRKLISPANSLFFALKGIRNDGINYISELYNSGNYNWVIHYINGIDFSLYPKANIITVNDTLIALQAIAAYHRRKYNLRLIGITGSNGKTIVKEWLYQLLSPDYKTVKSPLSYNSQIGVPLSCWQINKFHELGIFEAGISHRGEMKNLENVLKPEIGILTNIGTAHNSGFSSETEKTHEKILLFKNANVILLNENDKKVLKIVAMGLEKGQKIVSWFYGKSGKNRISSIPIPSKYLVYRIEVLKIIGSKRFTLIKLKTLRGETSIEIPFNDKASIENAITCFCVLFYLGMDEVEIKNRINKLHRVEMRLEQLEGINNCTIINDCYNSDLISLENALEFLNQQKQGNKKTLILSDILQSNREPEDIYRHTGDMIHKKNIFNFIGIGNEISRYHKFFPENSKFFPSTEEFLNKMKPTDFYNEIILIKGSRSFEMERIVNRLIRKTHDTVMEFNLNAMVQNLNYFKTLLKPQTKIMAMVKAFSYGGGTYEIANVLQYYGIDYLAVAYTDEGIRLREKGIYVPIIVMNPQIHNINRLIEYDLEPEIFSLNQYKAFKNYLIHSTSNKTIKIHLKLDTGMKRLGFDKKELDLFLQEYNSSGLVRIQSVFSHLSAADDKMENNFTQSQISLFQSLCDKIREKTEYKFMRHILNTSGVVNYPESQFDMVRLGIGLYGVCNNIVIQKHLLPAMTLKTVVSQIKKVNKGETIGYNRKGIAKREMIIATISIGYADGLDRRLSYGGGYVLINGKKAPFIGNICMDMSMVDVTGIKVEEGNEVIVFGSGISLSELSNRLNTIPYELLTKVSQRVKRVYFS